MAVLHQLACLLRVLLAAIEFPIYHLISMHSNLEDTEFSARSGKGLFLSAIVASVNSNSQTIDQYNSRWNLAGRIKAISVRHSNGAIC